MKRLSFITNSILIITLCIGVFTANPQTTHAVAVQVTSDVSSTNVANSLKNTLSAASNAVTAGVEKALEIKEFVNDSLAWALGQNSLQKLISDSVKWINSGFEGKPAFITNLDNHLENIKSKSGVAVVYGPELRNTCSTNEVRVRSDLQTHEQNVSDGKYTLNCTVDDLTDNLEEFQQGEMQHGGWAVWFEMGVGAHNDPVKAYTNAVNVKEARKEKDERNAIIESLWADGFKTPKICQNVPGAAGFVTEVCTNTTPGTILRDKLSFEIGELPALAILNGDEFNEMTSTLLNGLGQEAISGAAGLLGLGGNTEFSVNLFGDNGSQSYLDALEADDVSQLQVTRVEPIAEAIKQKEVRIELQQGVIDTIDNFVAQMDEGADLAPSCFTLALDTEPAAAEVTEEEEAEQTLIQRMSQINVSVNEDQVVDTLALEVLRILGDTLAIASNATEKQLVYDQFAQLQQQDPETEEDFVTTELDNLDLQNSFIDFEFKNLTEDFANLIAQEADRCNVTLTPTP